MNENFEILSGLTEVLEKYFNDDQLNEFIKTTRSGFLMESSNSGHIPFENSQSVISRENIRKQIDSAITFSERKLGIEKKMMILNNLGEFAIAKGEFSISKNIYLKILKYAKQEKKFENIEAYALYSLADIYNKEARWERSLEHINKAKKLFQKQKDIQGLAKCENLLGAIYLSQGKIDLCSRHFEQGISHLSEKRDQSIIAMMEGNLGTVNSIQGNFDQSFTFYRRALLKFEKTGRLKRVAEIRHNLGVLHTQKKQYDLALAEFDICLRIALMANLLPMEGISLLGKAFIYSQLDQLDIAQMFADRALKISNTLQDSLTTAEVYKVYGIIERKKKNFKSSENHFLNSLRLNNELENELNIAETSVELAKLYIDIGNIEEALSYLDSAFKYYQTINADSEIERINEIKNNLLNKRIN